MCGAYIDTVSKMSTHWSIIKQFDWCKTSNPGSLPVNDNAVW